jgi:hypothetical protein
VLGCLAVVAPREARRANAMFNGYYSMVYNVGSLMGLPFAVYFAWTATPLWSLYSVYAIAAGAPTMAFYLHPRWKQSAAVEYDDDDGDGAAALGANGAQLRRAAPPQMEELRGDEEAVARFMHTPTAHHVPAPGSSPATPVPTSHTATKKSAARRPPTTSCSTPMKKLIAFASETARSVTASSGCSCALHGAPPAPHLSAKTPRRCTALSIAASPMTGPTAKSITHVYAAKNQALRSISPFGAQTPSKLFAATTSQQCGALNAA